MTLPIYKRVLHEASSEELSHWKSLKTSNGVTLDDIISPGENEKHARVGTFAGDAESYRVFRTYFDKVIKYYHGINPQSMHIKDWDLSKIHVDEHLFKDKRIISTRVRVARNIVGFPFEMKMSLAQRKEVEKKIISASKNLKGDLECEYFPLYEMTEKEKEHFREEHLLYAEPRQYMYACGLANDWPQARGIFLSKNREFSMWVNEEDHLRIISMQKGGNIKEVFSRLNRAAEAMQEELTFTFDERLGYVNTCPTNIGTAMRASVLVHLPNLSENPDLRAFCFHFGVDVRGQHGEASNEERTEIFDISNSKRLGVSGVQVINFLSSGVEKILKMEDMF